MSSGSVRWQIHIRHIPHMTSSQAYSDENLSLLNWHLWYSESYNIIYSVIVLVSVYQITKHHKSSQFLSHCATCSRKMQWLNNAGCKTFDYKSQHHFRN